MQRTVSWRRATARVLLMSFTALVSLAACGTSDPVAVPVPVSTTPARLCGPFEFVAATHQAEIAAGRSRVPALTDDLTAYVVGLLPELVVPQTGLSVSNGPTDNGLPIKVFPSGFTLTIAPDSGLAPADLAATIMMTASLKMLGNALNPTDPAQLAVIRSVATTVAVDTYIKLAADRPETTHGAHVVSPKLDLVAEVRARLSKDFTETVTSFDGREIAADQPLLLLLRTMSNWFGHIYYAQTNSRIYGMHPPVDERAATALIDALDTDC